MPQLAVGLAGAAIGNWLGSAAVGWTVGLMVGNYLFAPDGPEFETSGPRLTDLNVSSAADGTDMAVLWGTGRMAGQVIWTEGITEHVSRTVTETGGKGGGGGGSTTVHTSYSYTCTFAISFGMFQSNAVRRIWANKRLIYDVREESSGAMMTGLSITFYGGSETQRPNAAIEAHVGVGNASAYRGQTYIVFNNLPLANFGNRIPSIEVEFTAKGDNSSTMTTTTVDNKNGIMSNLYGGTIVDQERLLAYTMGSAIDPYGDADDFYPATASYYSRPAIISIEAAQTLGVTFEGYNWTLGYFLSDCSFRYPNSPGSGRTSAMAFRSNIQTLNDFLLPPDKIAVLTAPIDVDCPLAGDDYYGVILHLFDMNTRRNLGEGNYGALIGASNFPYNTTLLHKISDAYMLYAGHTMWCIDVWNSYYFGAEDSSAQQGPCWFNPEAPNESLIGTGLLGSPLLSGYFLIGRQTQHFYGDIDPASEIDPFLSGEVYKPSTVWLVTNDVGGLGLARIQAGALSPEVYDLVYIAGRYEPGNHNQTHQPIAFKYNFMDGNYWLLWAEAETSKATTPYDLKTIRWAVFDGITLQLKEEIPVDWWEWSAGSDSSKKWTLSSWVFSREIGSFFFTIYNSSVSRGEEVVQFDTISREWTHFNIYDLTGSGLGYLGYDMVAYVPQRQSIIYGHGGITELRLRSVTGSTVGVDEIITDLCESAGITASEIDVSQVTGEVTGFRHSRRTEVRGDLQSLLTYGNIDALQSDWKLKFVPRGGASGATVPQDDLGAFEDGSVPGYFVERVKAQGVDKPTSLDIMYLSVEKDYQPGSALTTWYTGGSQRKATINLPIFLPDANAAFASEQLLLQQIDGDQFNFQLPRSYAWLEPSDVIVIPAHGEQQRVRITEITHGANDMLECKSVLDDIDHLTSYAAAAGSGLPGTTIVNVTYAESIILDTSLLRDVDQDHPGPYMTSITWGPGFAPISFYTSADDQTYTEVVGITVEPIFGSTSAQPPNDNIDWEDWDDDTVITVTMLNGQMSSQTEAQVLDGANAIAWGIEGRWEILNFKTATLIATDVYELTGLLRGRRNTQWARNLHEFNDWVILLGSFGSMSRITQTNAQIDSTVYYKTVIAGQFVADAVGHFYVTGKQPLMPYSPIQLTHGGATSDYDLTWTRRTRRGGSLGGDNTLTDGVGGEIEEDTEEYELDIFELADMTTPARTVTSISTASYTYTNAQAVTDGFVAGDTIVFRVYQISAVVGRGHPSADYIVPFGSNSSAMPAGSFSIVAQDLYQFAVVDTIDTVSDHWREGRVQFTTYAHSVVIED